MTVTAKMNSVAPDGVFNATPASSLSQDDKRLIEAVALYLATGKFSSDELWAHAKARRQDLLKHANAVEEKEAIRLLNSRINEAEYERLASYAADKTFDFDKKTIIYILRGADQWPFRLLKEAKQMSERS